MYTCYTHSLIFIGIIVPMYEKQNGGVHQLTNSEKSKIPPHTFCPKPYSFNRKDEAIITRLHVVHSKMSHRHLMRKVGSIYCANLQVTIDTSRETENCY